MVLIPQIVKAATWKKTNANIVVVAPENTNCPAGYVGVPALAPYTVRYFCVMKYEAKNDGYGTVVSIAPGLAWGSLDRETARSKCQALGTNYDLISNDQWQTIARNIAVTAINWSSGVVASGELNRGHSDFSPIGTLAAVADDNDSCSGTEQTCSLSIWDSQRRTHTLSNGNIIWDLAGNMYEWVTNTNNASNGSDGHISIMSTGIRQTRYGAATGTFCSSPGASPYCGMGLGLFNYSAGGIFRGGVWNDGGVAAGIFAVNLANGPTWTHPALGFRCVFIP